MSRHARKLSKTGLYHVIFRGLSRQNIFEEKQDYEKLLKIMEKVKEGSKKLAIEIAISKSSLERATGISRGTIIKILNN